MWVITQMDQWSKFFLEMEYSNKEAAIAMCNALNKECKDQYTLFQVEYINKG